MNSPLTLTHAYKTSYTSTIECETQRKEKKSQGFLKSFIIYFSHVLFFFLYLLPQKIKRTYRLQAGNATKYIICHAMTMAITATTITLVVRLHVFPSTETFGSFNFCVEHLDVRRAFSEFLRFMVCRLARRTQRKALSLINQYNFVCSTSRIFSFFRTNFPLFSYEQNLFRTVLSQTVERCTMATVCDSLAHIKDSLNFRRLVQPYK